MPTDDNNQFFSQPTLCVSRPTMESYAQQNDFQSMTNELRKTIQESCAVLRAEMQQSQQESYTAINEKLKTATNTKWKREGNHKQFKFNEHLEILAKA